MSVEEIRHYLLTCDRCGTQACTQSAGTPTSTSFLPEGWEDDQYTGRNSMEYGLLCPQCTAERDKHQEEEAAAEGR